jgi:hypothetical protein
MAQFDKLTRATRFCKGLTLLAGRRTLLVHVGWCACRRSPAAPYLLEDWDG